MKFYRLEGAQHDAAVGMSRATKSYAAASAALVKEMENRYEQMKTSHIAHCRALWARILTPLEIDVDKALSVEGMVALEMTYEEIGLMLLKVVPEADPDVAKAATDTAKAGMN